MRHVSAETTSSIFTEENPRGIIHFRYQQQFSINVLAGIFRDCLIGPHVLPHRLTGNHYRYFLLHDLPKLLRYVPVAVRARLWYMHDGAPAHFSRAVRDVLSSTNHDQWLGRGAPTAGPPCSPDLNPLDFYLWGHVKTLVYAAPVDNREALHHRIADASDYPQLPRHIRTDAAVDMSRRALNLVEDILSTSNKCTLSDITHKLNVSGHMLIWKCFLVLVCGTRAQCLSTPPCIHMGSHKICLRGQPLDPTNVLPLSRSKLLGM
jgi:transposase